MESSAMIGRITESGMPIAVENVSWEIAESGAQRMTAAVASTDRIPTLAISQNPARVSNILRSSTFSSRVIGMGVIVRAGRTAATSVAGVPAGTSVAVVMLLLLHGRSRR